MKTLIQLAALLAVVYAGWRYGVPFVMRYVGQSRPPVVNPVPGPGGHCVQKAARASEALYDRVLDASPNLYSDEMWGGIVDAVRSDLQDARMACACRTESCSEAKGAVDGLLRVLDAAASQPRASQSVPLPLARDYEQQNEVLWEAYDLARAGR